MLLGSGVSIAQVARDLDIIESLMSRWIKGFRQSEQQASPGHGLQKPDDAEVTRLRREVPQLKIERDVLKKPQLFCQEIDVKFGFVAKHRGVSPVQPMCEVLGVSRIGFYAWLTRPKSKRDQPDEVMSPKIYQSFIASDRTYGARSSLRATQD